MSPSPSWTTQAANRIPHKIQDPPVSIQIYQRKGPSLPQRALQVPWLSMSPLDSLTLAYPQTNRRSFGDRAFSIAAATEWNKLPNEIKSCSSVNSFKSQLTTHLFTIHYNWVISYDKHCFVIFFLTVYNIHWDIRTLAAAKRFWTFCNRFLALYKSFSFIIIISRCSIFKLIVKVLSPLTLTSLGWSVWMNWD